MHVIKTPWANTTSRWEEGVLVAKQLHAQGVENYGMGTSVHIP